MAKVEMDLTELRELENKIDTLSKEKKVLENNAHQVIVNHRYFKGSIKPNRGATEKYKGQVRVTGVREVAQYRNSPYDGISQLRGDFGYDGRPNLYGYTSEMFEENYDLTDAINKGLVQIDIHEDFSRASKDYKNMSEIIGDIHEEEKNKLRVEILEYVERARKAEYLVAQGDEKWYQQIVELREKHEETVKNLSKIYNKTLVEKEEAYNDAITYTNKAYIELKEKYNDLKDDKKRISLEQQIVDLTAALAKANKPWYKK